MKLSLRKQLGSVVILPLVILLLGSHWSWDRSLQTVREEPETDRVRIVLRRAAARFALAVQADAGIAYEVRVSEDGEEFRRLWIVGRVRQDEDAETPVTRRSGLFSVEPAVRFLELRPLGEPASDALSDLRVQVSQRLFTLDHRALLPFIWGSWMLLFLRQRRRPGLRLGRLFDLWGHLDLWIAGLLVYGVVFRLPESGAALLLASLILLLLWLVIALLRRAPAGLLLALGVSALLLGFALPRAFSALLISKISQTYDLSVDHRPRPDGREINRDGVRFKGDASDLSDDDFVVLFLGDSFTFGIGLGYQETYPVQFEAIASAAPCVERVRAVNFGWISSSPLLSLRLLREIGYKYRPDLLVYNLDMTDFHDDLRYEYWLRRERDFEADRGEIFQRLVVAQWPQLAAVAGRLEPVIELLRTSPENAREEMISGLEIPGPRERFFVTEYPLAKTRAGIELGVIKNLADMHGFADGVLGVPMALVVYPRAYQYSRRESPRNWEAKKHERLGPYAREPFRYFEEAAPSLPYATISLLPAFENARAFPLFQREDPHWNASGARFVAESVFAALRARGLLPCH